MKLEEKQERTSFGPFSVVLATLERHRVEYIVIGGQAVVAYGASQFTRDADLWINPTKRNLNRLRKVLKDLKATLRFLPPLKLSYLKKGHGVHFRFKYQGRNFNIDILGKAPRVSGFLSAWKDAQLIDWHRLNVPVLDAQRLIATKKTDRERDYPVIQLLGELIFEQARRERKNRKTIILWLAKESRNPQHLRNIARWNGGRQALLESKRPAAILAAQNASAIEIQEELNTEKEKLKEENREYWRPLISELRQLRRRL